MNHRAASAAEVVEELLGKGASMYVSSLASVRLCSPSMFPSACANVIDDPITYLVAFARYLRDRVVGRQGGMGASGRK